MQEETSFNEMSAWMELVDKKLSTKSTSTKVYGPATNIPFNIPSHLERQTPLLVIQNGQMHKNVTTIKSKDANMHFRANPKQRNETEHCTEHRQFQTTAFETFMCVCMLFHIHIFNSHYCSRGQSPVAFQ